MNWRSNRTLDAVAGLIDRGCDVGFVAFAVVTIAYHLAAAAHWSVKLWALLTVALLVLAAVIAVALHRRDEAPFVVDEPPSDDLAASPPVRPVLVVLLLAVAAVVAVVCQGRDAEGLWPITWLLLAATAVFGAVTLWRSNRPRGGGDAASGSREPDGSVAGAPAVGHVLALLVTFGAGVFALFVVRASADDVYYVNRAVWVAQHGAIPLRDTMFGNLVYPAPPGEKLPVASIEALQGAVARVLGVSAPTVAWHVTTVLATMVACWMLWRLVRSWARPERTALVFAVACVFLLWDGWSPQSVGNFHLVRLWQGKAVFVSCLVPAIYVWLTRWLRHRRTTDAVMLFLLGVCAVGLTSSAVFLVPMLAVIAVVAAVLRRRRGWLGPLLLALYPIGTGLVILAVARGQGVPATFAPAPRVLADMAIGTGVFGLVGWLALFVGPRCARSGWPRALALSSVGMLAVVMAPGVHSFVGRVSGAGPVIWRETWIVPLPVLVGLLTDVPVPRVAHVSRHVVAAVCAVSVTAVLVVAGTPLWSASNDAHLSSSPAWKVSGRGLAAADAILSHGRPRGLVLAPPGVMSAIAVTTTRVYPVVPRILYLDQLSTEDARRRLLLYDWVSGERYLSSQVLQTLTSELAVSEACLPSGARQRLHMLAAVGFTRPLRADRLTCRRLPGSAANAATPVQ